VILSQWRERRIEVIWHDLGAFMLHCTWRTSWSDQRWRHVARASSAVAPTVPVPPWPPCRFSTALDFLEIGNFTPFFEFLHIKGRHFPDFFPFKSTYDPYDPWKVSWSKSVSTFFRNLDRQTEPAKGRVASALANSMNQTFTNLL